jgi:hypothetical protein
LTASWSTMLRYRHERMPIDVGGGNGSLELESHACCVPSLVFPFWPRLQLPRASKRHRQDGRDPCRSCAWKHGKRDTF